MSACDAMPHLLREIGFQAALAEAVSGVYCGWASVGSSPEVYMTAMSIGWLAPSCNSGVMGPLQRVMLTALCLVQEPLLPERAAHCRALAAP